MTHLFDYTIIQIFLSSDVRSKLLAVPLEKKLFQKEYFGVM